MVRNRAPCARFPVIGIGLDFQVTAFAARGAEGACVEGQVSGERISGL